MARCRNPGDAGLTRRVRRTARVSLACDLRSGSIVVPWRLCRHPSVSSPFVERYVGRDKIRIVERAQRDGEKRRLRFGMVSDVRSAFRAEPVRHVTSAIGRPHPSPGRAVDPNTCRVEHDLGRKDASRLPLAGQTMTDRGPDRWAIAGRGQLAAAAAGSSDVRMRQFHSFSGGPLARLHPVEGVRDGLLAARPPAYQMTEARR